MEHAGWLQKVARRFEKGGNTRQMLRRSMLCSKPAQLIAPDRYNVDIRMFGVLPLIFEGLMFIGYRKTNELLKALEVSLSRNGDLIIPVACMLRIGRFLPLTGETRPDSKSQ